MYPAFMGAFKVDTVVIYEDQADTVTSWQQRQSTDNQKDAP
jgi:hypothetical protein